MATQVVCRYNKFGYCKFQDSCRILHVNEICDNPSCVFKECNKRHPKNCKFHRYKKCKFQESCAFSHDKHKNSNDESLKKFEQIETKLQKANKEIRENKINNEKLVQIETKIDNFIKLEKEVCEKDNIIEGLHKKLQYMEKLLEKYY